MKQYKIFFAAVFLSYCASLFAQVPRPTPTPDPRIAEWVQLGKNLETAIVRKDEKKNKKHPKSFSRSTPTKCPRNGGVHLLRCS
jgi:hypothetical protein